MNPIMPPDNKHTFSTVLTEEQKQLLKDLYFKGATDAEFSLFVYICCRTGLDPFAKQIHPVKRYDQSVGKEVISFQTGIDGYRLIADRTNKYMPGDENTFVYKDDKVFSATAYVKKLGPDGQWHVISATAHYDEYCAKKKDGTPTIMWATKPHIMLGKCAEALALRKAYPNDMSGIYTKEEMEQADNPIEIKHIQPVLPLEKIDEFELLELKECLNQCLNQEEHKETIYKRLLIKDLCDIPKSKFQIILQWVNSQKSVIQELQEVVNV